MVNEQKTNKEDKKAEPAPGTNLGDKPEETSIIERASSTAERLEKALEETRAENDRKERLLAEEKLGGRSGSHEPTEVKKEVTPLEYAKEVMSGKLKTDEGKK